MLMEEQKLIEKHAKAAGVDVKVGWAKLRRRRRDERRAALGQPAFRVRRRRPAGHAVGAHARQSRRQGGLGHQLDAAVPRSPAIPSVKSIKDFTEKDRIALPAVKVSIQAVTLQMAAEQAFGAGQQNKLDALTVVDGASRRAGGAAVRRSRRSPRISARRRSSTSSWRRRASHRGAELAMTCWAARRRSTSSGRRPSSRHENPKLYEAFIKALDEATASINRDKRAAAEAYLRISKDKEHARRTS